jgi:pimeloyl-ACP methyl ester carboxylesterase
VSGLASTRAAGLGASLRMTAAGVRDAVRALLGRSPYYAPIVGSPGTLAAMTSPDADPGYRAMYPEEFTWRNEVAARVFLTTAMYSPGRAAARVRCPLLVQVAARDAVTPAKPTERAARRAMRGELVRYPIGHFDIYVGAPFERAVADQLTFLSCHADSAQSRERPSTVDVVRDA